MHGGGRGGRARRGGFRSSCAPVHGGPGSSRAGGAAFYPRRSCSYGSSFSRHRSGLEEDTRVIPAVVSPLSPAATPLTQVQLGFICHHCQRTRGPFRGLMHSSHQRQDSGPRTCAITRGSFFTCTAFPRVGFRKNLAPPPHPLLPPQDGATPNVHNNHHPDTQG